MILIFFSLQKNASIVRGWANINISLFWFIMGVPSQGLYFSQEKVFLEYQINRVGEGVLIKGGTGNFPDISWGVVINGGIENRKIIYL